MNFRVHKMLSAEMDCCLRGGLCTPFYATNPKAMRVSVDLDLFMEGTREAAIDKITKVVTKAKMKIVPRKPRIIRNLLQFDLRYDTTRLLHDEKEHMKIDVMYGVSFNPPMKRIYSGHSIFTGKTDYDVTALTPGCLVADKIATLAINGTGYVKESKAPKQIHDIGYLLSELTVDDLVESVNVFRVITEFKTSGAEKGSALEVIQHVVKFLAGLLVANNEINLKQKYKSNFDEFRKDYLSGNVNYSLDELKFNVLKTLLYATCAKKTIMDEINAENAAKVVYDAISGTIGSSDKIRVELAGKAISGGDTAMTPSKMSLVSESESNLQVLYGIWKLENL